MFPVTRSAWARDQDSRDLGCEPLLVQGPWAPAHGPGLPGRKTSHPQPRRVTTAPSATASGSALGLGLAWPWLLWALGPCPGPGPQPAQAGRGPRASFSAWDPSPPGLQRVEENQVPRVPPPRWPHPHLPALLVGEGPAARLGTQGVYLWSPQLGLNALEEHMCVTALVSVLKLW